MKERPVTCPVNLDDCPGGCPACAVVNIESDRIPGLPTGGEARLVSPFDNFLAGER